MKAVRLTSADGGQERAGYPWDLPAIVALHDGLELHANVTYLIGENGSGKSTLLEAIAVAAGMNAEGGGVEFRVLAPRFPFGAVQDVRLIRGVRRPKTDFFLRAESLFTAARYLEQLDDDPLRPYGGRSLHEQSHGESFLAVLLNRFGPDGLYLLDEPEAALSTQSCLTCLRRVHELVRDGSQFIIATHSPIILAYPDAAIYSCTPNGLEEVAYEDAAPVRLTRSFLESRRRFLQQLFED